MAIKKTAENEIFLDRVSFAYDGKPVLSDLSLNILKGDFCGVIGPNGAGKSTLLKLMCRTLKPQSGEVRIQGRNAGDYDAHGFSQKVAVLPAEVFFSYDFPVIDIVKMGRAPYLPFWSEGSEKDITIVENALQAVGIYPLRERSLFSLSSGERQMVFLAQAMAQEPDILLLDEPTVHLDIRHQIEIFKLLRDWNESAGLTVIVISHDVNVASQFAKRLILMKNGNILQDGPPGQVITEKNIQDAYSICTQVIAAPRSGLPAILFDKT